MDDEHPPAVEEHVHQHDPPDAASPPAPLYAEEGVDMEDTILWPGGIPPWLTTALLPCPMLCLMRFKLLALILWLQRASFAPTSNGLSLP
jgi:hypothetical protein